MPTGKPKRPLPLSAFRAGDYVRYYSYNGKGIYNGHRAVVVNQYLTGKLGFRFDPPVPGDDNPREVYTLNPEWLRFEARPDEPTYRPDDND